MKRLAFILLCGWVLWHESLLSAKDKREESHWYIWDAYETRAECLTHAREAVTSGVEQAKKMGMMTESRATRYNEFNADKSFFHSHKYYCLPGGTDPRPRFKEGGA